MAVSRPAQGPGRRLEMGFFVLSGRGWAGLREAELCEENTCEAITASLMTRPLPRVSVSGSGMSGLACGDNNHGISIIPAQFITHRGPGLTSDQ